MVELLVFHQGLGLGAFSLVFCLEGRQYQMSTLDHIVAGLFQGYCSDPTHSYFDLAG